jgi:hypothetical protein
MDLRWIIKNSGDGDPVIIIFMKYGKNNIFKNQFKD